MEYKEIAAVSGKSGLFKIISPNKSGVILESLADKKRMIAGTNNRVSVLDDISIYTHTAEGSTPLKSVLSSIHTEFGDDPGVEPTSDGEELKSFLKHILPDYDESRVYVSDIKKVVTWYRVLLQHAPELLQAEIQDEKAEEKEEKKEK
jgi:hypothetical protein